LQEGYTSTPTRGTREEAKRPVSPREIAEQERRRGGEEEERRRRRRGEEEIRIADSRIAG
jgi:hypothetical protein